MNLVQRIAAGVNVIVRPLVASPRWGRLVGRWMTLVTYTGRRSGRTFRLPVAYSRDGDRLRIPVDLPQQKTWWRNFVGAGGPLLVRLGGVDRPGHAVAVQDEGRVTVTVSLDHREGDVQSGALE